MNYHNLLISNGVIFYSSLKEKNESVRAVIRRIIIA